MTPNPADIVIGEMMKFIPWVIVIGIASLVIKYFANKWMREFKTKQREARKTGGRSSARAGRFPTLNASAETAEERTRDASQYRYVAVRHVASPPEKILYERLCKALPELVVLTQVHLPRVVQPASTSKEPLERIIRKSLDFLICDAMFVPLVAIEVNDSSHNAGNRIASDNDKAAALKSADIPLIIWEARKLPNVEIIRKTILEHVSLQAEAPAPTPEPKPATPRSRPAPDQPA